MLIFPCVAAAASWSFLLWKFSGISPGNLVLVAADRRKPAFGAALLLPVLALALALWLGFDYSPGTAYFLFTLLAVTVTVQFSLTDGRGLWLILLVAAVAQVVVTWVWPSASPGYLQWWHLLTG